MANSDLAIQMPSPDPVRLLIVSDVKLLRECLTQALSGSAEVAVVAQAANLAHALPLIASTRPEVVLLDVASKRSLEIVSAISHAASTVKIIAIGVHDVERDILACAEAGVAGCFPCDGSLSELVATIAGSRRDEMGCSPRAAAVLFRRIASLSRPSQDRPSSDRHDVAPLTTREAEVIALIDRGLSNKEIAQQLHLELATVKNHVHNILEKLNVASRHHAARLARASGRNGSGHSK
jgi:DNA-binding NarL/FixJ family response regulator